MEDFFLDRTEISSVIRKRIDAFQRGYRQNIGLIGKQYIGKTSLIRSLLTSFPYHQCIPVYVELIAEPFDYFAKKFMGTILYSFMHASGLVMPPHFDMLVKRARKFLPKTLKKMRLIKQELFQKNHSNAFKMILSLTSILSEETGKKVVLIIDEFDRLQQFGSVQDPFALCGHEIMLQKDTMYVVTSSRPQVAEHIFREKLSLLFGNFETIPVLPFNFYEGYQFVEKSLAPAIVDPLLTAFITQITDGHPYYVSRITSALKRRMATGQTVVTEQHIIDALVELVYLPSGELYQHVLLLLSGLHRDCLYAFYVNILVALACGHKKLITIARYVEKDVDETKKGLQRLIDEQLVERSGSFYSVKDVLLRFWLKYVFRRSFRALGFPLSNHEAEFRSEVFDLIDSSCHEEHKELSKRVEELLRSFHNDVIELQNAKVKCPTFSEVYLRPTNGRIYPLYAKSLSTRWLCQVAVRPVEEEDVQQLVDDSKKMRQKVNKRILITPYGISLNAKLMAKQENIMIWNLRNLNHVFDLYDKPKMIIDADLDRLYPAWRNPHYHEEKKGEAPEKDEVSV